MLRDVKEHDCNKYLNDKCRCRICGKYRHNIVNDSKGFGTGMVTAWCKRCGGYERYYDDTGTTIISTFAGEEGAENE